jgi:hypothetical protein
MDAFKSELLKMFVSTILPVVATAISGLVVALLGILTMKIKNAAAADQQSALAKTGLDVLARATEMMKSVVAHVENGIKAELIEASKDGEITAEEAAKIKALALDTFKNAMGTEGMAALKSVLGGGVDTWVSGLLERVLVGFQVESAKAATVSPQ